MNLNQIIGQHRNAVALSFYKFGYGGPIIPDTLQAMIDYVGQPFLQELSNNIALVGYAATDLPILVPADGGINTSSRRMASDMQPGGIFYNQDAPEPVPLPPPVLMEAPPAPPTVLTPPDPVPPAPPLLGNGGMLGGLGGDTTTSEPVITGIGSSLNNALQSSTAQQKRADGDKPIWERYQTAIIVVVVIIVLVMMFRKSPAPVIIK